ncbi:hypothetical protein HQ585_01370 [candidate division KSB1 bacterium]|nr:hypothetical protein [candidate division KSB1 bacterium]
MRTLQKVIIGFMLGLTIQSYGSINETLPSWHWAYGMLDRFQTKGYVTNLLEMNRPYSRGDVAEALIEIRSRMSDKKIALSPTDQKLFVRLVREFATEIQSFTGKNESHESIEGGAHLWGDLVQLPDSDVKYKGIYRTRISASIGPHVTVYNGSNFDQYKVDDSTYVGKKWRGVVGFSEQAYLSSSFGRFRLKFGRDFLRWGAGRNGTLLFSDVCRPLDQFLGSADIGPFRFSFVASALDDWKLSPGWADSLGTASARRYLSAHRIDASFLNGKLQLAASELMIYGGIHRPMDFVYLNPFLIFHGAQMNKKDQVNTAGCLDLLFYPSPDLKMYGSLLIDDIQVEKTGPGDLEPNEMGWILGGSWADPFQTSGLSFFGEFARVTNRTYKTPTEWEAFVFRNEPIGYPLGHDFDTWDVGLSQWFGSDFFGEVIFSRTRKGEGSLFTSWDAPWFEYTVEEGYSEPYITGIVETVQQWKIHLRYAPSIHWGVDGLILSRNLKNAYHIPDETKNETEWRIRLWLDGAVRFRF